MLLANSLLASFFSSYEERGLLAGKASQSSCDLPAIPAFVKARARVDGHSGDTARPAALGLIANCYSNQALEYIQSLFFQFQPNRRPDGSSVHEHPSCV